MDDCSFFLFLKGKGKFLRGGKGVERYARLWMFRSGLALL